MTGPACTPRRKIRGMIALVVRGGEARITDAVVLSRHRTREAADKAALLAYNPLMAWHQQAYVVWADEFVDAGGVVP